MTTTMAMLSRTLVGRQATTRLRARQRTNVSSIQGASAAFRNLTGLSSKEQEFPSTRILLADQGFSRILHSRPFSLLPPSKEKQLGQSSRPSVSILPTNNNNNASSSGSAEKQPEIIRKGNPSRTRRNQRGRDRPKRNTETKSKSKSKLAGATSRKKPKPRKANTKQSKATTAKPIKTNRQKAADASLKIEQDLQQWYEQQHDVTFKEKCIYLKKVKIKGGALSVWTAHFTCPITDETFACGTLTDFQNEEEVRQENGQVVYNKMMAARAAAMGRALDCFQYRQQKSQSTVAEKRNCIEMPYAFGAQPSSTMSTLVEATVVESENIDEEEDDDESSDESDDDDDEDSDGYYFTDDEDDEEYTIQYLPGTSSNSTSQQAAANPIARVIGNWANSSSAAVNIYKQNESDAIAPLIAPDPELELLRLLGNARAWIDQEQPINSKQEDDDSSSQQGKNAHRVMLRSADSPQTLDIANSMLNGLATANRRVYFPDEPRGVEDVAARIVKYLWSTTSAHPNADTYISYLGCLEGPDPIDVAIRAKSLLDDMKDGSPADVTGEKPYPKPSIGVVNAVIQLFAQVGGESGRFDLDEVENPNRETFLSVLSSMSYPATIDGETGGFDPIFAKDCIERMKVIAKQNPSDLSLQLDTQVYNAGLRWSGGLQSTISRPYMMRPVPWDSHAEIYRNGFLSLNEDDQTTQDAYRMHAWLEEMASLGDVTAPSIETYEAVIQAYVRTGTKDGIKQAERLLDSLLSASSLNPKPRVQTFHPILAAWAHSGDKEGPQKVNKWINRVDAWGGERMNQDQDADFRLRETPLLANATRVIRRLETGDEISDTEASDLVDIAHGCSAHLKDLSVAVQDSNQEGVGIALDSRMFLLVLEVWGLLGVHFLEQPDEGDRARQALEKIRETLHDYEALIASFHDKGAAHNDGTQICHLMDSSHELYSLMLTTLRGTMGVPKPPDSDWMLENHLNTIEKWVRRVDEFSQVQATIDKSNGEHVYGDLYTYHGPASLPHTFAASRTEFLVEILKLLQDDFIEDCSSSPRRGDMIRLCFLIMKVLPSVSNDSDPHLALSATHKEVVRTVCHLANSPVETEALLDAVLNHVEGLRDQRPPFIIDRAAIVKEMKKLCPSLPNSRANRSSRKPRRGSSSGIDRPSFRRHRSSSHRSSSSMAKQDDGVQTPMPQNQSTGTN